MKNIASYVAGKYKDNDGYKLAEEGIYFIHDGYVTSLVFEQEPELGEGDKPSNISQYPLEDILDKYLVYVSDFYEELNAKSEKLCYLEFTSDSESIDDVKALREIIGKHVYDNNGRLVIE